MMNLESLTPEELVDGFVLPVVLRDSEREEANRQLAEVRRQRVSARTIDQVHHAQLLQFQFDLEDYLHQKDFDSEKTFSHFLVRYVALHEGSKQEFATELGIHKSLLSQLLSGTRNPTLAFLVRLEIHSRQMIPAVNWFRLLTKQQEYLLREDEALRIREKPHVKSFI